MTPQERHQRIKELFSSAAGVPIAERAAHLRAVCDDPGIIGEVEHLLRSAEGSLWPGDSSAPDPSSLRRALQAAADGSAALPGPAMVGSHIGRYLITGIIAEGGMGIVYE